MITNDSYKLEQQSLSLRLGRQDDVHGRSCVTSNRLVGNGVVPAYRSHQKEFAGFLHKVQKLVRSDVYHFTAYNADHLGQSV